MPTPAPAGRRVPLVSIALLVILVAVGVAVVLPLRTPVPVLSTADTGLFSVSRAAAHLPYIARRPHPTGSQANAEVRDYVVTALTELGLDPTLEGQAAEASDTPDMTDEGTATNIHAVIEGTDPTGSVLLVAHYDSVPSGPGASDDAANVAAILEIARVFVAGPTPRNTIEFLFTDAEEDGLRGATAFTTGPTAPDPDHCVVLNLDARGVTGPVLMFESVGDRGGLMTAVQASEAMATSASTAVYHRIPGIATDLTVFDEAGFRGLNFALVGGSSMNHTANDTIEHVDRSALQQMGTAVLAAARQLTTTDLQGDDTSDVTYFTVAGTLIHYPNTLTVPLAGFILLGYIFTVRFACRRSERAGRVATAAATFLAPVGIAVMIGSGVWALLNTMRPDYADFLTGDIPTASRYAWAECLLAVAAVMGWYLLVRRWHTFTEVALGITGWFTALACVTAVAAPGAAYPFIAIAAVATTTIAAATRWCAQDSSLRFLACTVAGILTAALILPLVVMVFPALGIAHATVPLVLVTLSAGVLAPLLEGVRGRVARIAVPTAIALVALGLTAVGVHADT